MAMVGRRYSVYLLYWYKGTNTDAEGAAILLYWYTSTNTDAERVSILLSWYRSTNTDAECALSCFIGTQVQILAQKALVWSAACRSSKQYLEFQKLYWYTSTNTDAEGAALSGFTVCRSSKHYLEFEKFCCKAYLILRKHARLFH